jgi:hypothetical protein
LLAAKAQLTKLPDHIALLLLEDSWQQQQEQLASLVLWAVCFGIHSFSLYDPRGRLKLDQGPD